MCAEVAAIGPASTGSVLRILTPDQRLRVFISSTLQERAPERVAAEKAVRELRLTPVLFELGAAASAAGALPRLPPPESRLRRHLLAELWLGRG